MEPTITAEVIAPCYIGGEVAEVGKVVKVSESDFVRLHGANCLIEKEKEKPKPKSKK